MHTIPNHTTANVRAEGARRGYSMHQLALSTGIPVNVFYRRLQRGNWRLAELQRIADSLGVTLSTLTGDPS